MKNTTEKSNRWYDTNVDVSESFTALCDMSLEYQHLFGQILILVTQRVKDQNQPSNGLTSLGSERVMGLMKSQHKRRASDKDKVMYKAFTNMFLLGDQQRGQMAERLFLSMACADEYQLVCQRLGHGANYREMGQLISETLEKGLYAGERYLINIERYDKDAERVFAQLRLKSSEPPPIIQVATSVPMNPAEAKQKARLRQDDGGMKIHNQEEGNPTAQQ